MKHGVLSDQTLRLFQKCFQNNIPIFLPLILVTGLEMHSLNAVRSLASFRIGALVLVEAAWILPMCLVRLTCCSSLIQTTSHPETIFRVS